MALHNDLQNDKVEGDNTVLVNEREKISPYTSVNYLSNVPFLLGRLHRLYQDLTYFKTDVNFSVLFDNGIEDNLRMHISLVNIVPT